MKKNKKFYMVSLGCPKNRVDSEIMFGELIEKGYKLAENPEDADTIIVNTCGFLESAKEESIATIMEMAQYKEGNPNKKLVVAGCLTQRYSKELEEGLDEADYLVGVGTFQNIADILEKENRTVVNDGHYLQTHETPRINSLPFYTAYLKIAEGCSNNCSFCIIPKIRGTQTSRTIEDIVLEAKKLVKSGVKEINLVSQELTAYGEELYGKPKLYELLIELVKIEDLKWLRLFYNYPAGFSDELIDLIATNDKIVNYIDLPLQHISNNMLKMMFRAGRGPLIRDLIKKIRNKIPDAHLRASFIVGFPGETEEDFNELYEFIKEVRFEHLGVFEYSPEEGTEAATMDNQIDDAVKKQRRDKIMKLQNIISGDIMEGYVEQVLEVIVDGVSEESEFLLEGRHRGQAIGIDGVVYLNDGTEGVKSGDIVKVYITQAGDYDLVGSVVKESL
jgi:ribosomal protein S12 methylthiotransferase